MAAYAGVASLMNTIEQIMNHRHLSASFENKQIESLHQKAGDLLDFITCNGYGVAVSKQLHDLERAIARAAHAAEDVIESHIVDQIHARSIQSNPRCSHDLQQIIQLIDASILEKVAEFKENRAIKDEELTISRNPMAIEETAMVGFDDELYQLKDELTGEKSSRCIISITGMGGTGKTTLARNVYECLLIKQHFDIRAWATISQPHNAKEIFSQLLSNQGDSFSHGTVDELGLKLHKTLSGRRYLIVLDDLWSVEAWDEVRRFFPDNGNRSRIVVTTRLSNVASDCCSTSLVMMKPLDDHQRWRLFCMKAFEQENCPCSELEIVGKEIARLCRGLPLSTVVIGGLLLKSPRSLPFWESVARNIKSVPGSREKEESLDILSLSYDHLPPHLKPCFLYMGIFKEDSKIRFSKIIKLWIAEGFLRPKNSQMLEEVAESYLNELIDRNLILAGRRRQNGRIGSCSIHDLVRDLCLKVGEQEEFFHVVKGEIRGTERRLICPNRSSLEHIGGPSVVRSVLAGTILKQPVDHKLLKIWDCGELESLKELYGNVNLRYLAFPLPRVWKLPRSVSLMWNLQTIILVNSLIDSLVVHAPIEIWKMRQLRHVECDHFYLPHPPSRSDGLFMMDKLQTLTRAVNLRVSEEVCKMIPNIKKLHVDYDCGMYGYDDNSFTSLHNLGGLHKLESLKLIVGEIMKTGLNKIVRFPLSLKKLSLKGLSGSVLNWDDVSMIGPLPHLEVLELISITGGGSRWSLIEGQFPCLKSLKIDDCYLYSWNADRSHFPILEKLVLRNKNRWVLEGLEIPLGVDEIPLEIPLGVGEIPTLELIVVDYCSVSTAISAVKIKEAQLENQGDDDALQIQLRMSNLDMESFKRRLETEGLTLKNVQFIR